MSNAAVVAGICLLSRHHMMMFAERTQFCLHWRYARLSAVMNWAQNAAVVLVHDNRQDMYRDMKH